MMDSNTVTLGKKRPASPNELPDRRGSKQNQQTRPLTPSLPSSSSNGGSLGIFDHFEQKHATPVEYIDLDLVGDDQPNLTLWQQSESHVTTREYDCDTTPALSDSNASQSFIGFSPCHEFSELTGYQQPYVRSSDGLGNFAVQEREAGNDQAGEDAAPNEQSSQFPFTEHQQFLDREVTANRQTNNQQSKIHEYTATFVRNPFFHESEGSDSDRQLSAQPFDSSLLPEIPPKQYEEREELRDRKQTSHSHTAGQILQMEDMSTSLLDQRTCDSSVNPSSQTRIEEWIGSYEDSDQNLYSNEHHRHSNTWQTMAESHQTRQINPLSGATTTQPEHQSVLARMKARLEQKVEATRARIRENTRADPSSESDEEPNHKNSSSVESYQSYNSTLSNQVQCPDLPINSFNGIGTTRSKEVDFDPYEPPPKIRRRIADTGSNVSKPTLSISDSEMHDLYDSGEASSNEITVNHSTNSQIQVPQQTYQHLGHNSTTYSSRLTSVPFPRGTENCLTGLRFYFRGSISALSQAEARALVKRYGGKVCSEVNKKTTHIVLGVNITAEKADFYRSLQIAVINESELFDLIATLPAKARVTSQRTKAGISRKAGATRTTSSQSIASNSVGDNHRMLASHSHGTTEANKRTGKLPAQPTIAPIDISKTRVDEINTSWRREVAERTNSHMSALEVELLEKDPEMQQLKQKEEDMLHALEAQETKVRLERVKAARVAQSMKRQAEMEKRSRALNVQEEKPRAEEALRKVEEQKKEAADTKKKATFAEKESTDALWAKFNRDIDAKKAAAAMRFRDAHGPDAPKQGTIPDSQALKASTRLPPDVPPYVTLPTKPHFKPVDFTEKELKEISKAAKPSSSVHSKRHIRKQRLAEELKKVKKTKTVRYIPISFDDPEVTNTMLHSSKSSFVSRTHLIFSMRVGQGRRLR
jgi:BRCT domain type II-containing protein